MEFLGALDITNPSLLFVLGLVLLILDLAIFGLSGFLLFAAGGCLTTGLLVYLGILADVDSLTVILAIGLSTAILAMVLWTPLKKLQNEASEDKSSDMIGLELEVVETITLESGKVRYSGINWDARLNKDCDSSEVTEPNIVKVIGVNGTILIVEKIN